MEGSAEDRAFVATYQRDGATVGVFALNSAKQFTRLRRQALRGPAPVGGRRRGWSAARGGK